MREIRVICMNSKGSGENRLFTMWQISKRCVLAEIKKTGSGIEENYSGNTSWTILFSDIFQKLLFSRQIFPTFQLHSSPKENYLFFINFCWWSGVGVGTAGSKVRVHDPGAPGEMERLNVTFFRWRVYFFRTVRKPYIQWYKRFSFWQDGSRNWGGGVFAHL